MSTDDGGKTISVDIPVKFLTVVQALIFPHYRIIKLPGVDNLLLLTAETAAMADEVIANSLVMEVGDGEPGLLVDPEMMKRVFGLSEKELEELFTRERVRREQGEERGSGGPQKGL